MGVNDPFKTTVPNVHSLLYLVPNIENGKVRSKPDPYREYGARFRYYNVRLSVQKKLLRAFILLSLLDVLTLFIYSQSLTIADGLQRNISMAINNR